MRGEFGTITLIKDALGWHARFSGPVAKTMQGAFGTATIQTAYTADMPAGQVQRAIAARWKDCVVVVEGGQ